MSMLVNGRRGRGMRILLVEDDDHFARSVRDALTRVGHVAVRVSRGSDALIRHHEADLVLLDIRLPDSEDLGVLRNLRAVTDKPVIMLTAIEDEPMVVSALRIGADDYLRKPVGQAELLARIGAVARRVRFRCEPAPRTVVAGDVEIDLAARRVGAGGDEIVLTATEFEVLATLARHHGLAVSRRQLIDEVWGDADPARGHTLGVHLTTLRKKLDRPGLITTIHGFGYRLED